MALLRPTRAALLLSVFVVLGGCWLSRKGPEPPELSEQITQTQQRTQRVERIIEIMEGDLDEFERLRQELFETPESFYASPFPLDLFKHVAMACLNEPWNPNELEDEASSAAIRMPSDIVLTCRPTFAARLDDALQEQVPTRRKETLQKLERVDAFRQLRGKLRDRISAIPGIIESQKNYVADERAELRQLRASLERRRTEYSAQRWSETQSRLDERAATLDTLSEAVDRLQAAWPQWPERVDKNVLELYMRLSELTGDEESWTR